MENMHALLNIILKLVHIYDQNILNCG